MAVRKLRTLAVAGAATAALAFGMTAAEAAGTWTLTAGAAAAGSTVTISGTTTGSTPQVHFTDTTTGTELTCTSAGAKGKANVGSGLAGRAIGTITGSLTTWTGCTGPLGIALNPAGVGVWKINAQSYNAGVTTGTIAGIAANVTGTGCSFKVSGSVPVTYSNTTRVLTVKDTAETLSISNVSGCFGAVGDGDTATFKAKYKLKGSPAANNPIQITKP